MKNQNNEKSEVKELRHRAEEELKTRKSTNSFSEVDNLKLMHELQVHQIELEMQNEELIRAREQAEALMEKYVDLYDFAPSGYVTLSEEGNIIDLNFSAATMLGNDRIHLKNTRFGLYITPVSLDLYNEFFEKIFRSKQKQTCELVLRSKTDKSIYVHVDALLSQNTNTCLITMIDITERKEMEIELQKALNQYKDLNRYFLDRELRMVDLKKEINKLLLESGCEEEYLI
jgi:PAS domain S-box-containing protein